MPVTKKVNPIALYQQWSTTSGLVINDILGVEESLGRAAQHCTIESVGGDTIVRFNVCYKIYKNQQEVSAANASYFGPQAAFWDSPVLVDEKEVMQPEFTVAAGQSYTWDEEFPIFDIKVIAIAPTCRIAVD